MTIDELRAKWNTRQPVTPPVERASEPNIVVTPNIPLLGSGKPDPKVLSLPYMGYEIIHSLHTGNWWVQEGMRLIGWARDYADAKGIIDRLNAKGKGKSAATLRA